VVWLILVGVLAFAAIWWLGSTGAGSKRAPNVLNNQGLPRGYTREDHRRNDEE
jgi:hypothetical protein